MIRKLAIVAALLLTSEAVAAENFDTVALESFAPGRQVLDCSVAFAKAIASFPKTQDQHTLSFGGTITVSGSYTCSSTIKIARAVRIVGAGSPTAFSNGPVKLQFPAGVAGFVLQSSDDPPAFTDSMGVSLENLTIAGTRGTSSANGVEAHTRFTMRNVNVLSFDGDCVAIHSRPKGTKFANPDLWRADTVWVNGCGGDGWHTVGRDSNAGLATNLSATHNGGWGIDDESFLGNTYIAGEVAYNHTGHIRVTDINARNAFIGTYVEGGTGPHGRAVNLAGASTTVVGGMLAMTMLNGGFVGDATFLGEGSVRTSSSADPFGLLLGSRNVFSKPNIPPNGWSLHDLSGAIMFFDKPKPGGDLGAVNIDGHWYSIGKIGTTPLQ